jgi:DNA-binding protein YbaB
MKEHAKFDISDVRRILKDGAHAAQQPVVETAAGLVEVTMDGHLCVQAVEFLDCSLDAGGRAALQQATIDAVNGAIRKAVLAKAEAFVKVQERLDWKTLIRDTGRGGQP